MLSPERKDRIRSLLLAIKTPEKRRQVIRVALEYARLMHRLGVNKGRNAK